jgi:hypothetical protein
MKKDYLLNVSATKLEKHLDSKLTVEELMSKVSKHLDEIETILDKIENCVEKQRFLTLDVLVELMAKNDLSVERYSNELARRGYELGTNFLDTL